MAHFKTITEMTEYWGISNPIHPLFLPIRPSKELLENPGDVIDYEEVSRDFYIISLKKFLSGNIHYGKTQYDGSSGTLLFSAPGQIIDLENVRIEHGGFNIYFDKEYFVGHPIFDSFSRFNFFDYASNEALNLSEDEEESLQKIYDNIESEYYRNADDYSSKEIIIVHIEALLKYADRYYRRQLKKDEPLAKGMFQKFKAALSDYMNEYDFADDGQPTIDWLAGKLSVSKRYLSDNIKTETGKTAKDQIMLFLVEHAKNLLLSPDNSITDTAYKMGFKHPQYFTQVFKKKTGMSPKEYVEANSKM